MSQCYEGCGTHASGLQPQGSSLALFLLLLGPLTSAPGHSFSTTKGSALGVTRRPLEGQTQGSRVREGEVGPTHCYFTSDFHHGPTLDSYTAPTPDMPTGIGLAFY